MGVFVADAGSSPWTSQNLDSPREGEKLEVYYSSTGC